MKTISNCKQKKGETAYINAKNTHGMEIIVCGILLNVQCQVRKWIPEEGMFGNYQSLRVKAQGRGEGTESHLILSVYRI